MNKFKDYRRNPNTFNDAVDTFKHIYESGNMLDLALFYRRIQNIVAPATLARAINMTKELLLSLLRISDYARRSTNKED